MTQPNTGQTSRGTVASAFDAAGNLVFRQTQAQREAAPSEVEAFEYDALGRLLARRVLRQAGPGQVLARFFYDEADSPVACGETGPSNAAGRLRKYVDSFGQTWLQYDGRGRLLCETRVRGQRDATCTGKSPDDAPHTEYRYSLNGNLTSLKYPHGLQVLYGYGQGGLTDRVSSVSLLVLGASGIERRPVVSSVTWEPFGGLAAWQLPSPRSNASSSPPTPSSKRGSVSAALHRCRPRPGSRSPSSCTSLASKPRSSITDFSSGRAVCSGRPASDARIEGGISSPLSMMATSVVVRTAPNRTRAINQTDQVAINKLASQQSGRFWRASKDDGFLFLGDAGEVLHVDYLTQLVRRYLEAAGIERPGACHLFRHSMATAMLEGGADVRFVQEMLGHASLETTQLYTRVTIDKLKAVHAATHPAARALRSGAPLETASAESVLNALAEENEE